MQSTIETSVFGIEFVAMKIGVETLHAIWYESRIMEIPISEPTYIYGDNKSVTHNTLKPEDTLMKKCNSIA